MIVFNLGCENSHRFEGWFSSSDDFEDQVARRQVSCPLCGNANVARLPHASYVNTGAGRDKSGRAASRPLADTQPYANIGSELIAKLVEQVIENTEDVGAAFPEEARKIHYREAPERRIRGTATREEAESLKEEGVEIVALPIPPHRLGRTH